ncbi:hypothetical protein [Cyanobium sp. ULC084]
MPSRHTLLRPIAPTPTREAGFFLPLSFGVGLVLLLSSLSVQTAALHGSQLLAAELRQRQADDALASAAQQVAAQFNGPYGCLLATASATWPATGCGPGAGLAPLLEAPVGSARYRLLSWQPVAGELRLALEAGGATASRQQGLFRLRLDPARPAEVLGVRSLGR